MRPLRIAFSDFWPGFDAVDNRIWEVLSLRYKVELCPDIRSADLLVFGDFGTLHWDFAGRKVYLTGENMVPDFEQCDLAFSPLEIPGDRRAIRLPYYAQVFKEPKSLLRPPGYTAEPYLDRPAFCSFVASNPSCRMRNKIFKSLHHRRPVASGGMLFNTTGGRIDDKMAFLGQARFNLACENSSSPGYVTEKLVDAINACSIPIYWGAPDVCRDFDPRCLINISDFEDLDEATEAILRIDHDKTARRRILEAPVFHDNVAPECMSQDYLLAPLLELIENRSPARRHPRVRQLHEHIKVSQSLLSYKFEKFLCKLEAKLWRHGLRG
jgi:hypothetical protein